MIKSINRKTAIITSILLLSVACVFAIILPKIPQILAFLGITGKLSLGLVKPLQVEEPILENVKFSAQGLDLVFTLPIHNPNPYPADIETVRGNIYINGNKVSHENEIEGRTIPAKKTRNITIRANADIQESIKAAPGALLNKLLGKHNSIRFEGFIETKIVSQNLKLPINTSLRV